MSFFLGVPQLPFHFVLLGRAFRCKSSPRKEAGAAPGFPLQSLTRNMVIFPELFRLTLTGFVTFFHEKTLSGFTYKKRAQTRRSIPGAAFACVSSNYSLKKLCIIPVYSGLHHFQKGLSVNLKCMFRRKFRWAHKLIR